MHKVLPLYPLVQELRSFDLRLLSYSIGGAYVCEKKRKLKFPVLKYSIAKMNGTKKAICVQLWCNVITLRMFNFISLHVRVVDQSVLNMKRSSCKLLSSTPPFFFFTTQQNFRYQVSFFIKVLKDNNSSVLLYQLQ